MKRLFSLLAPSIAFLVLAGCSDDLAHKAGEPQTVKQPGDQTKPSPEEQAKITAALDRLPPEDKALAEAQQFCAVETENRLGLMGTPVKVLVNGQPVFLCCKGCKTTALEEPDKTLAKVQQLRKAAEASGH
jgi:hypothetical protein